MGHLQALERLRSRGNEVLAIHLGLDRMRAVLDALDAPERRPRVVHVAGTNGKGSTAAMAEAMLRAAGRRTGLYTSPHLERLTERIRIAGRDVPAAALGRLVERVARLERRLLRRGALERPLTYFEVLTVCAFLAFAEARVEVAVIEVGLGGRLDATNVVQPAVSVITGVSRDHAELLGPTLAAIAVEKAGIIKPGVPVVSACRGATVRRVVRAAARAARAPLMELDHDYRLTLRGERDGRSRFDLVTPRGSYRDLRAPLRGVHQTRNAAVAIAALEELDAAPLARAVVRRGLAATRWPGRLEALSAERRTLLDGAHNAEGAAQLAGHLRQSGPNAIDLVFGALADKDVGSMAAALFPLARHVHLSPVPSPRGVSPADLAARFGRLSAACSVHDSPRAALRAAWRAARPGGLVVVAGSLYLIGALRSMVLRAARRRAARTRIPVVVDHGAGRGSRSGSNRLPTTSLTARS